MSGEAQLEALLEIINISARQAITEYKKGGNNVPTIHSKTFHPLDFAIDAVALRKAVRLLEGACQQLCASLAPPQRTIHKYSLSFNRACVDVVIRARIVDALQSFPDGLHVDELANQVDLEKGKLARVLRLLATNGCFTEVAPDVFSNNRISLTLSSDSNSAVLLQTVSEDCYKAGSALYETMTEPEHSASYKPEHAPFIYAIRETGFKGSYFDWLKQDTDKLQNFHRAMNGVGQTMGTLSILHHYPWNEVKTVCDVGSGIGTISIPLSKMYPHLKIINQDLPEVLAQAKHVWAKNAPEALLNNRAEFIPLNFLEGSPAHGQDVYYLHNIIHNWPDAEVAVILKNIRNAMVPRSRLLIHGCVLGYASHNPTAKSFGVDVAPEPLLPNFGHGNNEMYQLDLNMWCLLNGKERTLDDLIALGLAAGLQLDKVYDLVAGAVLEFRIAACPNT